MICFPCVSFAFQTLETQATARGCNTGKAWKSSESKSVRKGKGTVVYEIKKGGELFRTMKGRVSKVNMHGA